MKFLALHALLSVACSSLSVPGGIKFDSKKLEHGLSIARQIESQAVGMATPGNCSVDFRARMKPCEQQGEDWCWATGISEWSYFYNISNMTAECDAVECAVVSMDMAPINCCPYSAHKGCGQDGETVPHIVSVASNFTHRTFESAGQALYESHLQEKLMAGITVMPIIQWSVGGGHALMVAGCQPAKFGTNYWLHDPLTTEWELVSYMRIVQYQLRYQGTWVDSVYSST